MKRFLEKVWPWLRLVSYVAVIILAGFVTMFLDRMVLIFGWLGGLIAAWALIGAGIHMFESERGGVIRQLQVMYIGSTYFGVVLWFVLYALPAFFKYWEDTATSLHLE